MEPTYRILAQGCSVCNDTWQTGLNNNDLIIGPSGAGKTRGYVMPNILQCSESMVITDTKDSLYPELAPVLKQEGYLVVKLDFADCARSPYGYNPFSYIRKGCRGDYAEQDILTLAAGLVPLETKHDPYWELTARICLESIAGYVLEALPEEEQDLTSVIRLAGELGKKGCYRKLMEELATLDQESFALSRYRMVKSIEADAEKTSACVYSFLASKLAPLSFGGAKHLFRHYRQVNLKDLGKRKTALFLTVSDMDSSLYRLADVFYTQALQVLCAMADKSPSRRLKVPVRFYLDDFASNVVIPDFDRVTSQIRSRGISVSVMIQSLSQLEAHYGRAKAMTIVNNCDNLLCLGAGRDLETARYISAQADKPVSAVLNTPRENAWLLTRGVPAKKAGKYDLKSHPLYGRLPEAEREKETRKKDTKQKEAAKERQPRPMQVSPVLC